MKKNNNEDKTLELRLSNGKTKSFANGYQMWKWYHSNSTNSKDSEKQELSLSDFFRKRNSK